MTSPSSWCVWNFWTFRADFDFQTFPWDPFHSRQILAKFACWCGGVPGLSLQSKPTTCCNFHFWIASSGAGCFAKTWSYRHVKEYFSLEARWRNSSQTQKIQTSNKVDSKSKVGSWDVWGTCPQGSSKFYGEHGHFVPFKLTTGSFLFSFLALLVAFCKCQNWPNRVWVRHRFWRTVSLGGSLCSASAIGLKCHTWIDEAIHRSSQAVFRIMYQVKAWQSWLKDPTSQDWKLLKPLKSHHIPPSLCESHQLQWSQQAGPWPWITHSVLAWNHAVLGGTRVDWSEGGIKCDQSKSSHFWNSILECSFPKMSSMKQSPLHS